MTPSFRVSLQLLKEKDRRTHLNHHPNQEKEGLPLCVEQLCPGFLASYLSGDVSISSSLAFRSKRRDLVGSFGFLVLGNCLSGCERFGKHVG